MFNIAIFGRPNVGKSTLFNALVRKKKAIVSNVSGVTVDRNYGIVKLNDISFNLIDTAGIIDETLHKNEFTVQTLKAIEEADLVFFVTDYSSGILPYDFELSSILRKTKKNVIHLVNKCDAKNNVFSISFGKLDNATAAVELLTDKFLTSVIFVKSIVPAAVNVRSSKG